MRMSMRRLILALMPAMLIGAGVVAMPNATPLLASAATPSIGFEVPRVADPIHTYGEPDIAVDPTTDNNVAVSGPTGTGTQRSVWQSSVDAGHTFRNVARCPDCTSLSNLLPIGPLAAPGGGDTEIAFDRSGKQYFADLYALAQQHVATRTTNSSGNENVQEGLVSTLQAGSDRQWMAVYDPPPGTSNLTGHNLPKPLVYLVYNNLAGPGPNSGQEWTKSTTGAGVSPYSHANADCSVLAEAVCSPFGGDGYPAIDQETGKVFEAAACGPPSCAVQGLYLNIGTPVDDAGNLHFLDYAAAGTDFSKLVKIAATPTGSADTLFSVLSMDRGRNLHVAWAVSSDIPANRQVFVSAAPPDGPGCTNCWTRWTTPVQVSAPPSLVNIFPWIQAGAAGYSDAVWYGSDKNADPSMKAGQAWNVFMAQVKFPVDRLGHVTGPPPAAQVVQVKVSPHPMKYNDICLLGSGCVTAVGNRNLADFFEIKMDSTGAPEIVYDDLSNGLCQLCPGGVEINSHKGAPVVTIARQSSGIGLLGTPVSGPSNAPVSGLSDPSGDARNPLFGNTSNNVPGLDILHSGLQSGGTTLTVTMDVGGNVKDPATVASQAGCPTCQLQYVTRWQMGNILYYAMMETDPVNGPQYFAGQATDIDDCSVSACDPHMLIYPDVVGGTPEPGTTTCPASPGPTSPCTFSIKVSVADVGNPHNGSLLEEVAGYAFTSTVPQSLITQAIERADSGAREVDGVCCYNFAVAGITAASPVPAAAPPSPLPSTLPNTTGAHGPISVGWPLFGLLLVALGSLTLVEPVRRRGSRR